MKLNRTLNQNFILISSKFYSVFTLSYLINAQSRLLILNILPPCSIEFHPVRLLNFGFFALPALLIDLCFTYFTYISIKICRNFSECWLNIMIHTVNFSFIRDPKVKISPFFPFVIKHIEFTSN